MSPVSTAYTALQPPEEFDEPYSPVTTMTDVDFNNGDHHSRCPPLLPDRSRPGQGHRKSMSSAYELNEEMYRSKPWWQAPSIFWLLPIVLVFSLAMGMTAMPRTNVIVSLICRRMLAADHKDTSDIIVGDFSPRCASIHMESQSAMFSLWGNLISSAMAAITAPLWGRLSDRLGRVRILIVTSCMMIVEEVVVVLIARWPDTIGLNWIYIAFLLDGISGSFFLMMALASSYAADCTAEKERNVGMGWFHGVMFLGMGVGPAFGGYLGVVRGHSNPLTIFYTSLGMRTFAIIILILLVPESLPLAARRKRTTGTKSTSLLTQLNPMHMLRIFIPSASPLRIPRLAQRNLIVLAAVSILMFGGIMSTMGVMMLYSEFVFKWTNKESGAFLTTIHLCRAAATVLILPLAIRLLARRVSPHNLDMLLLRVAIISDIIGFVGYALAPSGTIFTLAGVLASLGAIGLTTSEAVLTKIVGSEYTGELMGAMGFLQALARIVGPSISNLVYSRTATTVPSLVFWGGALAFLCAGAVSSLTREALVGDGSGDSRNGVDDGGAYAEYELDGNCELNLDSGRAGGGRPGDAATRGGYVEFSDSEESEDEEHRKKDLDTTGMLPKAT